MVRSFLSFCLGCFKSRTQFQLENVFLRKQLEIVTRTSAKPRLRPSDRFLFRILTDVYDSCKETLLIVKPETVIPLLPHSPQKDLVFLLEQRVFREKNPL